MVISRYAGALVLAVALLGAPVASPGTQVPSRIVSLSPTATEDLFAIGAGKQVVAVDSYSTYPPSVPHTKLSAYTPNAEAIAAYKPDLVVISFDSSHIKEALAKLHITVLLEAAPNTLSGAYAQIEALGKATGHIAKAAAVVTGIREKLAAIAAGAPRPAKPITVYHELDQTYYSATSKSFIGNIYKLLGLRDIADPAGKAGSAYPKLSAEYIVAANPDLIVLADTKCCGQTAAKVEQRPGWGTIAAVSNHEILAVNDDVASHWGPRIVLFAQLVLAKARAVAGK